MLVWGLRPVFVWLWFVGPPWVGGRHVGRQDKCFFGLYSGPTTRGVLNLVSKAGTDSTRALDVSNVGVLFRLDVHMFVFCWFLQAFLCLSDHIWSCLLFRLGISARIGHVSGRIGAKLCQSAKGDSSSLPLVL